MVEKDLYRVITLPTITLVDESCLFIGEQYSTIPFEVKRVFCLYNFPQDNMCRGYHAHYECQQLLFCIQGSYTLTLDNTYSKISIKQSSACINEGVFVDRLIWVELSQIEKDSKIFVFASHLYKEQDYIRNYEAFRNIMRDDK